MAGLARDHLNAGAAVGLPALSMNRGNLPDQARIFLGAWAGLGLAVDPVELAGTRTEPVETGVPMRVLELETAGQLERGMDNLRPTPAAGWKRPAVAANKRLCLE